MTDKIQTVILKPDQYEIWDNFVDLSPQGDNFCYSWWLETITESNFKILAIFDKDEIVAGFPLALDRNGKVTEPPLTRTLGPLYKDLSSLSEHKQVTKQRNWLNALLCDLSTEDVVVFCTHRSFTDWLPFRWKGFQQMTRYTYIINYENKDINDLWKDLSRGRKEPINCAYRNGITISSTNDLQLLYSLMDITYKRQNLKFQFPFNAFKKLDDEISKRNMRKIFIASDKNGHIIASLYVTYNKKSAFALLSGGDPKFRRLGGHTLIMWEAIKYFHNKTKQFNFGGSDIERIENHLRGFGGILTPYFLIFTENFISRKVPIEKEIKKPVDVNPVQEDWKYHLGKIFFHQKALMKKTLPWL